MIMISSIVSAKMIREYVRTQSKTLSVRLGTGTASTWVSIHSKKGGMFDEAEQLALFNLGLTHSAINKTNCHVIAPEDQEFYIMKMAGIEQ